MSQQAEIVKFLAESKMGQNIDSQDCSLPKPSTRNRTAALLLIRWLRELPQSLKVFGLVCLALGWLVNSAWAQTSCTPQQQLNQQRYWFFGYGAGIDFGPTLTTPTAITAAGVGYEGSAVATDNAGNLLFYVEGPAGPYNATAGSTVYNPNGSVMTNGTGILQHQSMVQGNVAFQAPNNPDKYFIVTNDFAFEAPAPKGTLRYSVVDLCSRSVTQKNIAFDQNIYGEALTAIPSADPTKYWVFTATPDNRILAYLFDSNGYTGTKVTTTYSGGPSSDTRILRLSPDGTQLLLFGASGYTPASGYGNTACLFDINVSTGQVALKWSMTYSDQNQASYGAEFSPDGNYIYLSGLNPPNKLYQFNIAGKTTGAQVFATKYDLGFMGGLGGQIMRGPDGKIYTASATAGALGVINNPNVGGAGANYVPLGLPLAPGKTSSYGLPQMAFGCAQAAARFDFQCSSGTPTASNTFVANGTSGQTGTVTIPISVSIAGSIAVTVLGSSFTTSPAPYVTTIASGQTSLTIPVTYNGTGVAGPRSLTLSSPQTTGTCSATGGSTCTVPVTVQCSAITNSTANNVNPTVCGGSDGSIKICGLVPNSGGHTIRYDKNSVPQPARVGQTADANGCLILPNLTAGTYTNIQVTNPTCAAGSNLLGPIVISEPAPPTAPTASITSLTICSGDQVAINYTTNPAGQQVHWTRQSSTTTTGLGNITEYLSATGTAPETYTYSASVTSYGCPSPSTITTVTVYPRPIVTPSVCSQTICAGQTGAITFASSLAGTTINWLRVEDGQTGTGNISQVFNTSGTFTYKVWGVSTGTSCPSSTTITCTVVVKPGLTVTASVAAGSTGCLGTPLSLSATVSSTGTYTYSWTGPNGFVSNQQNPQVSSSVTTAMSGNYTVTVTDASGCSGTATVPVVVQIPASSENKIVSICNNETVDLAGYFPAGGTFSASTGLTGSVFSGITSGVGSFTVTYMPATGTCSAPSTAVVVVRNCTPPACDYPVSIAKIDATCGNSDGSAQVAVGGLSTGATVGIAWSNGKTGSSVIGLSAGVYSVTATITTATGVCTVVKQVQINDIGSPETAISQITSADCQGANGAVAINILKGAGPFQITWSGTSTGSQVSANLGITTISNLAPGNYTFAITSAGSTTACKSYLAVTIPKDDSDQITLTATPTNTTACGAFTGSIVATATPAVGVSGPFSFSLNGVLMGTSSVPTYTFTGLKAGVYTVNVASAGGCSSAAVPVTILDSGAPAVAGWTVTNPTCPSDKGQLVFAGGQSNITYWVREVTTGAIVGSVTGINGNTATTLTLPKGTYSIEGKPTSSTCTSYTTVSIVVPEGLNFNVQYTKATCAPGGVAANDGTISVVQITGATQPYSVVVMNAQGQVMTAASAGFYQNLAPGVYTVKVTDSKGCFGVENVFVTIPDCKQACPDIAMNTYVVDANCGSSDGRAVAQLGSFTEDQVDYQWSNGFFGKTSNGLASGVYSVTATVLTGTFAGCPYVKTVNVNEIGGPVFEKRTIVASSCAGSTGSVSFSVVSGTGPYKLSWTGPTSGTASIANTSSGFLFTRSNLAAGDYVFTLTNSESSCKSTQDVTIPSSSSGVINLTATPVMASGCGAQDGAINLTVSPSGTYLVSLNGAAYTASNLGSLTIPNLPASTYTVSVSAANGCTAERTLTIGETGAPAVSGWMSQSATCATDQGALIFAGGQSASVTYRVLLGGGSTVVATVQGDVATTISVPKGTYVVERKETVGSNVCTSFQSFTVSVPNGIDFNIQYTPETCGPGGTGNVDGKLSIVQVSGGTQPLTVKVIKMTTGAVMTDLENLVGGDYKVTVTDANGCTDNTDALITVPPCLLKCPPLAFNTTVIDNQCGKANGKATAELLNIPAGATVTYTWSNGQNGAIASGLTSGVYSVKASLFANNTIYAGCAYVDTVNVNDIGGPIARLSATQGASCTAANGAVALSIQSSTGPYMISWTGAATGSQTAANTGLVNIANLKAGNYVFTVTDAASACKSVIDVVVPTQSPNGFTVSVTPTNASSCGASDGKLKVTVSGGIGPFTYWVNSYIEGVSTTRTFTKGSLPAGVYAVEVTDANGCAVRKENTLINATGSTPIAGWTKTNAQCPQNTGTLQFAGTGSATDEYVVTLSGTATEIGRTQGNVAATYSVPGGTYLITKTSSTSCTSATVITVNQPDGFDVNIQFTDPTCTSLSAGNLKVVQPWGGTGVYSYLIAGAQGVVSTQATATGLASGSYTVTVGDANGCSVSQVVSLTTGVCSFCFHAKVYLQGSILFNNSALSSANQPLMRDDLRQRGMLPMSTPYGSGVYSSIAQVANPISETMTPSLTAVTGDKAVVDWVLLELRDKANPSLVRYTRSGLVLRDGTIVDVDGSCLNFNHVAADQYYVAVRHRNHLGVMTAETLPVGMGSGDVTVDFRTRTPGQVWDQGSGVAPLYADHERYVIPYATSYYALWAGNANRNMTVVYQGQGNDPSEVYNQIAAGTANLFISPSYILPGYYSGDVDMNGDVIFQGQSNEPAKIFDILVLHPTNWFNSPSYVNLEQLP